MSANRGLKEGNGLVKQVLSSFSKEIGNLEENYSQESMSENDLPFTPGLQKEAFSI